MGDVCPIPKVKKVRIKQLRSKFMSKFKFILATLPHYLFPSFQKAFHNASENRVTIRMTFRSIQSLNT